MKLTLNICLVLIFLMVPAYFVYAEEGEEEAGTTEQSEEEKPEQNDFEDYMDEVIVTGTRTQHKLSDSPTPVDLVTQEEIESSGARDTGDALEGATGVFVDDYESHGRGGPGTGINLHGLQTDRILLLIDGQRIPKAFMAPDLEIVPASLVNKIEVVKGPSSALYGSDAVGGVINVITKNPTKKLSIEGGGSYGSFNTFGNYMLHSYTAGPFAYLIAYNRESSDGWIDDFNQKSIIRIGVGREGFNKVVNEKYHPYETNDIFGKYKIELSPIVSWRAQARWHWESSDYGDVDKGRIDIDMTRLDYQTGLDFDLGSAGTLSINGYGFRHNLRYRQYESIYVWDLLSPEEFYRTYIEKGNDTTQNNYRGEIIHSLPLGTFNLFTYGIDARYELLSYEAFEFSMMTNEDDGYSAYQTVLSLFVQDEMFLFDDIWTLAPGARLDYHPVWGAQVNPKLSTLVKAVRTDPYKLYFRASVGRAFKEPSLSQLYRKEFRHTGFYLTGNEELQPEKSLGWNAEIEQQISSHVNIKMGYFQYEIDDMIWRKVIDANYTGGFPLMAYSNIKKARSYGFEGSIRVMPHDYVTLVLQHTYTDAKDAENDQNLGTVAPNQSSGQFYLDIAPWEAGLFLSANYTDIRQFIGMGGLWYTAEPRWGTKARIYKKLFGHIELYLEAQNLLNSQWDREGDQDNDMPPFNVFGGIKAWL